MTVKLVPCGKILTRIYANTNRKPIEDSQISHTNKNKKYLRINRNKKENSKLLVYLRQSCT